MVDAGHRGDPDARGHVECGQPRLVVQPLGLVEHPARRPEVLDRHPGRGGDVHRAVHLRVGEHVGPVGAHRVRDARADPPVAVADEVVQQVRAQGVPGGRGERRTAAPGARARSRGRRPRRRTASTAEPWPGRSPRAAWRRRPCRPAWGRPGHRRPGPRRGPGRDAAPPPVRRRTPPSSGRAGRRARHRPRRRQPSGHRRARRGPRVPEVAGCRRDPGGREPGTAPPSRRTAGTPRPRPAARTGRWR